MFAHPSAGRATLGLAAAAAALTALAGSPAHAEKKNWTLDLTGKTEVPGPGHPSAAGTAVITVDDTANTLRYTLAESGLADATAAHIHKARKGVEGPVVVPLTPPGNSKPSKACPKIDHDVAKALIANPDGYYVNVRSTKYPKGAIRAQL